VEVGEVESKYTYDEAVALTRGVFADLEPEFEQIFVQLTNGQVDVVPTRGKRGGAFCANDSLARPTFVFLNYTNELRDVTTLAHEMGHAIHAELMRKHCNGLNFGAPTSIAEVASTFMEDFVYQRLTQNADDKQKVSLQMSRLNDDVSTIYRQIAAYKFERALHEAYRESGHLSTEDIGGLFQEHMSAYMGSAVEQSPGSQNWWIYWGHIRYYFYNYSYAFGLLISKALQARVATDPTSIQDVKKALEAGSSASPRDIFKSINLDIAHPDFWTTGLGQVQKILEQTKKLTG
jgi:oligoendopeptidase F